MTNHPDSSVHESFFPDDDPQEREWLEEDHAEMVWSVQARGMNDAMRQLHLYEGWAPYEAPLRDAGSPYPEDEDDDYQASPS